MDEARVVEIWNPAGGRTGSGYLLGDDLVLTSCHVLDGTPAGGAVEVRQLDALGRTRWLPADVVWLPSPTDADADAALLRVTDDRWHPRRARRYGSGASSAAIASRVWASASPARPGVRRTSGTRCRCAAMWTRCTA
ncbi:trypsin-like peptidase domain-containing protein [Streptomyces sp. ST1015]|uniref:trypsin-like peptidase domain-containing protein n=1 Tax=Streptomyces sp. ST1015 TaxID=1848900 RepID=UPI001CA6C450|nr:trypsin-like peptidase domain-containing protein [Streptomyces sp. ST1015]QZZ25278.1 trypsin-like peptidase domain-containing protein [Streptomyces sp. ST1015]